MKKWKKISQKLLLEHPRLNVFEDLVTLPNGDRTTYIHFGKPRGAVTIISVNEDGLLLVQKEYSYPPNDWLFQFPGGAIEKNETPEHAAARELSEEANLTGQLKLIGWYYPDNRRLASKMYVFTAINLQTKPGVKDAEEVFENHWLTKDAISKKVAQGEVVNYSMLAAWAFFVALAD